MPDFDPTDFTPTMAPRVGSPLSVRFYRQPIRDEVKTKAEGHDIFVEQDMVEIRVPGDSDVRQRPVREADKKEWPHLWEAFTRSQSQEAVEGFPLHEWSVITRAQAEELKYFGMRTVEQLAGCPDSALQRVGPYMQLRTKARDWLAQRQDDSEIVKVRTALDDALSKIAALEEIAQRQAIEIEAARTAKTTNAAVTSGAVEDPRLAEMEAKSAALVAAAAPKRRGRPPKPKNGTP